MSITKMSMKSTSAIAVLLLTLGVSTLATTQANAEQVSFVEDAGGSQRIDLSGKLRMLSQRIPAAACNLNAGIASDESSALLTGSVNEFQNILDALTVGNDQLGIYGAETRHRTLRVIQEVHTKLDPVLAALQDTADGTPSDAAIGVLADTNMGLLEIAKLLVAEISGEYANPVALRQSDVIAIDIAGRQRMLTQKMSKEVCLALSGFKTAAPLESLQGTMRTFEASHDALRNGMASVGLTPAPTAEIAAGLDQVKAYWSDVRGLVENVSISGSASADDRAKIFTGLNTTMAEMNRVVGLYSEASKLGL